MLEEASFLVLSSQRVSLPFGNCCDFYKSRNGASLSKYKDLSISNYVGILNATMLAAMRSGRVLELADGTCIATEEEHLALVDELTQSVIGGGFTTVSDWIAMRPPGSCEGTYIGEQKPSGHAT
jgi:hypothetical protein